MIYGSGQKVVWEMEPHQARSLAEFIKENVCSDDLANRDVHRLNEAADIVDPPDKFDVPNF